jgi:DNA-binding transcriptional MerR regulator
MSGGPGLLRMREVAERAGVSPGTVKHYLREGVLGPEDGIVRTSRNMAYYPPELVERIGLVKRLQEDRFLPLRVIREIMADGPGRARALLEAEDRILERAVAAGEAGGREDAAEVAARTDVPAPVLERLAALGVLTPGEEGYDPDDVAVVEAMGRFRAGGFEERLGFTVYDTLRYTQALEPLVQEEVRVLHDRLAGEVDPDRAAEIIAAGAEPLRELIGALHSKLLRAELRRQHRAG